jgi:hypothetical protein
LTVGDLVSAVTINFHKTTFPYNGACNPVAMFQY